MYVCGACRSEVCVHMSVCGLVCVHEVHGWGMCECMCACDMGGCMLHMCVRETERVCVVLCV